MKVSSDSMNYMLTKAKRKIKQLKRIWNINAWGVSGIENRILLVFSMNVENYQKEMEYHIKNTEGKKLFQEIYICKNFPSSVSGSQ